MQWIFIYYSIILNWILHVTIGEYHLDIVPLDDDLLSMELDNSFKDLFLV